MTGLGLKAAVAALALGYVLPTYSILRRVAQNRDDLGLNTLKVEGSAAVAPSSAREVANLLGVPWQSGELMLGFTVTMKLPGRCRIELVSTESTKALAAVSSNGKRRMEGGELPALQVLIDQVCALLALRGANEGDSRVAIEKHLAALKVNAKNTSIARFRGGVAYVLGDVTEGAPQFWVYKPPASAESQKDMHPARVRFTDDKQVAWDVHFFDFASQGAGEWFPRLVQVSKGTEPVLRLTTLKGDNKAKLDDASF